MYKLKLLIVFLLVGYSSFSQIGTSKKDSIVVLSEREARLTAIDLVKYDSCKQIEIEQDTRIFNFKNEIANLENQVLVSEGIISEQKKYIKVQDELLNKPKKIEFHGYVGIKSDELKVTNPSIYGNLLVEYNKWSTGASYFLRVQEKAIWGIVIQYKIF